MANKFPIETLRHSTAHIMAAAIQKLWPDVKFGIGPTVEGGFYYDIDLRHRITPEDFSKIEKEMNNIIKADHEFKKEELSLAEGEKLFKQLKQPYKIKLIKDVKKYGTTEYDQIEEKSKKSSKKMNKVSIYKAGDFVDLCRGPHVKKTSDIRSDAFKLLKTAAAYWRGDEKNPQLQRIYGTAFNNKKELDEWLVLQEEIEKRDHRKLGRALDLFTTSELVGSGLPLFTPKGTIIREQLEKYVEKLNKEYNYKKVWIPHLAKPDLYKVSGHWEKFKDDLFHVRGKDSEFVIKPMNCPHHTQIYASKPRSYRDLPVRFFETTTVYRDEQSGELGGLTRVRCITQDDGHTFLRESQIEDEISRMLTIQNKVLKAAGFNDYFVRLSMWHPNNKKAYLGDEKTWDKAQKTLAQILRNKKIKFDAVEGEAAFYGPKMDLMVKDSLNREWQLSTIQLDFNMPGCFKLEYVDEKGKKQIPVMIHRAFMGSTERFIGVLLEHHAGALPFWLSPIQMQVITIGSAHKKYANEVADKLHAQDFRVEIADENETVGKKIREGELQKIPYLLIIGDEELKKKGVNVRDRDTKKQNFQKLDKFIEICKDKLDSHK